MHQLLIELAETIVPWIKMTGIDVVLWGAIEGLVKLLRSDISLPRNSEGQ